MNCYRIECVTASHDYSLEVALAPFRCCVAGKYLSQSVSMTILHTRVIP